MQRFSFILVLSVIFTGYLFSQSEENEIIKTDTVVVIEPVDEQKEKKDFKKNDFYNDYLSSLKKNNSISLDTTTTFAIDDCKKIEPLYIGSLKVGAILIFPVVSVGIDIPIYYRFNIAAEFSGVGWISGGVGWYYGLGVGYTIVRTKCDNFILKLNTYISNIDVSLYVNPMTPTFNIESDILFKMSKHTYISINIGSFVQYNSWKHHTTCLPHLSLGLNVVF